MVTIREIAKAAGVSPMTVSNVLNNRPHVRDTTRARVQRKIEELGYHVNGAARDLRRGRTHTIGLAVAELDRPYYGDLATNVVAEARNRGYHVLVEETSASRDAELGALAQTRVRRYDGLILSAVGLGPQDAELLGVDFPVVVLGERIFDSGVDHVAMPNVQGAAAAVQHLRDQGAQRIAGLFAGAPDGVSMSSLRREGYHRALANLNLTIDPDLSIGVPSLELETIREAIRNVVNAGQAFDGLFCATDYAAIAAVRGLADVGLRVPQDVMVIGFDNSSLSSLLTPSLSSIDTDTVLVARTAVDLLIARIEGNSREAVEFTPPFRVVPRESTGYANTPTVG